MGRVNRSLVVFVLGSVIALAAAGPAHPVPEGQMTWAVPRYASRGRSAFESDELLQTWVVRHLQIIGHHIGASFDEAKVPFYAQELASRIGFARTVPNAVEGVEGRLRQWPRFAR